MVFVVVTTEQDDSKLVGVYDNRALAEEQLKKIDYRIIEAEINKTDPQLLTDKMYLVQEFIDGWWQNLGLFRQISEADYCRQVRLKKNPEAKLRHCYTQRANYLMRVEE